MKFSNNLVALLLVSPICIGVGILSAQSTISETTRLQKQVQDLREMNLAMNKELAQCQLNASAAELRVSREAVNASIRTALGAKTDDEVDYTKDPPILKEKK